MLWALPEVIRSLINVNVVVFVIVVFVTVVVVAVVDDVFAKLRLESDRI